MSKGRSVEQILANPESAEFKNKATKITSWTIRADAVRRLDRGEAEPRTPASETSDHSSESSEAGTF